MVEIKPDVKVKKPKAGEAAAAAPAAAAEAAPGAKKEKKEPTAEKKDKAPKEGEATKPTDGKKKEKKAKEPKAAAPAPVNEDPAPWMVDLRVGRIVDGAFRSLPSPVPRGRLTFFFHTQSRFTRTPTHFTSRRLTSERPSPVPSSLVLSSTRRSRRVSPIRLDLPTARQC